MAQTAPVHLKRSARTEIKNMWYQTFWTAYKSETQDILKTQFTFHGV